MTFSFLRRLGDPGRAKRRGRRTWPLILRSLAVAIGIFAALVAFETHDAVGQLAGDMEGSHPIGIENETQKQLFYSLICQCGCPRETLGTCPCNFAHQRREEMRAALAEGKSVEAIQDEYVARYGPQALGVPRDKGANRLIWTVPLLAIVLGAAGLVLLLRRWRRRSDQDAPATLASAGTTIVRDDYDDKLDDELRELDRE